MASHSFVQQPSVCFGSSFNDRGSLGSLLRRLHLPKRPDGVKQKQVKLLAYRTRLGLFYLSLVLWLESCSPQWCSTLAHRLRNLPSQCKVMGRRIKALVLRLCGLRSSPSSILAALEHRMSTLEQPRGELEVCDWCRMSLHHKCVRKTHVTGVCICDCERGY